MKLSELIAHLQAALEKHGDLPVMQDADGGEEPVKTVEHDAVANHILLLW